MYTKDVNNKEITINFIKHLFIIRNIIIYLFLWSIWCCPRFFIIKALFKFEFKCNLSKLLLILTNFEFFRKVLILKPIWLIIIASLWEYQIIFHQNPLLKKLDVITGHRKQCVIFHKLFKITSIIKYLSTFYNLSNCFLSLLAMNWSKFLHLI
jgi:hypothetical protein